MYDVIIFDLDGTLTDSLPGIINGVQYSMSKLGRPLETLETIISFIGKPVQEALDEHYGAEPEVSGSMLRYFREYYSDRGVFENELYPGIAELLAGLRESGATLAVATAKGQASAELVLEHFGIREYFDLVVGAQPDGTFAVKADTIREVLRRLNLNGDTRIAMVGDRQYDVGGAVENGIEGIGVLHGYGTTEELEQAGATHVAADTAELGRLLLG